MYIDKNGFNLSRSASGDTDESQMTGASEASYESTDNSPGYAPISPNTPSWGPPASIGGSGGSDDNSPGYAPISPNTPSWGPPASIGGSGGSNNNSPGYAPISPNTPSWRPPASIGGSGSNSSGSNGSSGSGGTVIRPVIVLPGQGCINCSNNSNNSSGSVSNTSMANIRFLHAAANQPAVNVQIGNRTVINNMQFGNSTPYYLNSGSQTTLITITNTRTGRTLYRSFLTFADNTAYTVSIINDGSGISLFTLTDTPCTRSTSGCMRAVNLSPNSGPVDIFLSGYGRVFQGVGQLAATGYRAINQGTYRASVSEALPCSNNNSVIMGNEYVQCNNTQIAIMDSSTFNVMNGVTYTLYIIGLAYQFPSLQILPLESDLIY